VGCSKLWGGVYFKSFLDDERESTKEKRSERGVLTEKGAGKAVEELQEKVSANPRDRQDGTERDEEAVNIYAWQKAYQKRGVGGGAERKFRHS